MKNGTFEQSRKRSFLLYLYRHVGTQLRQTADQTFIAVDIDIIEKSRKRRMDIAYSFIKLQQGPRTYVYS